MNALSPWAVAASAELAESPAPLFEQTIKKFHYKVLTTDDSVWIQADMAGGGRVAFRAAYCPGGPLVLLKKKKSLQDGIELSLSSAIGHQKVRISLDQSTLTPVLRYTSLLTPSKDLILSYWPKDVLFTGKDDNP